MHIMLHRLKQRIAASRGTRAHTRQRGYTLTELFVVCVLLTILAAVAFPVARFTSRRQKEIELRHALHVMRNAIDEHKRYSDRGLIPVDLGTDGYPTEWENLLEGIQLVGALPDTKKKFLRRIPIDPMTGEAEWGLRCYEDDFDADSWCGENLFDVYSMGSGRGLNGIPYSEW
jgi:general secretion pathway protein G